MVVFDVRVRGKPLLCIVILNLILVLAQDNHYRRDFRDSRYKLKCSTEENEKVLKINKQITIYLSEKETTVYYYENVKTYDHTLAVTITPCSSTIKWSFMYEPHNETEKSNETGLPRKRWKESIGEGEDSERRTVLTNRARRGCYFLILTPLEGDTRVNVYLTMDNGGPFELVIRQEANLMLIPQKNQRLKVTWVRSLINPHNTSYCIVVSKDKEFMALCAAEEEGKVLKNFDEEAWIAWINTNSTEKTTRSGRGTPTGIQKRRTGRNTVIICVDQKLQLTLTKMEKQLYYFSLFAINHKTNFTIPYGQSHIKYNYKAKPITLQDGKRRKIDLKKHSGEVYFRFKAYKKAREINFYVLVCGGTVKAEFTRKDRKDRIDWSTANVTEVFGYKRFNFKMPGDYFLKISIPNTDEWRRVEYVEVFATAHPIRYPLPAIPEELSLYEYQSRRSCNSITIGWIPEPDNTTNKYCVTVRENKGVDLADKFRASFQCHLDSRTGKGFSSFPPKYEKKIYVYRKCKEQFTKQKISITNHTITNLKPGRSYTIQVTVEKKNGRTLSYKLLKAVTKHSCDL